MPATYDSNILDTSMRRLPNCTLVRGVIVLELCQADRRHVDLVHRPLLHASELGLSDSGSDEGCHEMWVSCSTVALADERTCPLSLTAPPHWAAFLSAAVFRRRISSRTSALSSSVSLEVSMARAGSATRSRTTATRR